MTSQLDLIDIQQRISNDFKDKSNEANSILKKSILKTVYLDHPRIIRCIVFLANGDIESLKKHINAAIYDPRDVMFWAEYQTLEGENPKRVRDFNNPI